MPHPRLSRTVAVLWSLALLVGLLLPVDFLPAFVTDPMEPAAHVVLFGGSAWVWLRVFPRAPGVVIAGLAGLAAATEALQAVLPFGRGAEALDVAADLAGLALGLGLWLLTRKAPRR